jgi:hypothetical protein
VFGLKSFVKFVILTNEHYLLLLLTSSNKKIDFFDFSVAWLIGWALVLEYTIGGAAVARGVTPNLV